MDFRGETHKEAFRLMRQCSHRLNLATNGRGLTEITGEVADWLEGCGVESGLLTLSCRHTSASRRRHPAYTPMLHLIGE
jgi:hypothetical protein